jgi:transposase
VGRTGVTAAGPPVNGIIHRLGTGVQWRELPERFGPSKTVHKRHLRWSADGVWERLLHHLQAVADAVSDIDWDINVDSTSIRAHQRAAGAPRKPPPALLAGAKGAARRSVHVHAHMRCTRREAVAHPARPWAARAAG